MRFHSTELDGVVVVEPDVYRDDRGFFLETYHASRYREGGIEEAFVQDNHSRSVRGVLRGLHAQRRNPQGKLVRALRGAVFDVAVDIRPASPTFGEWVGITLSEENARQLYVPPGFAHGFCVTSEVAEIAYKCTRIYDPTDELVVRWNDPQLAIRWPVESPILSAKDRDGPRLQELLDAGVSVLASELRPDSAYSAGELVRRRSESRERAISHGIS